jgi:hypothetical protein
LEWIEPRKLIHFQLVSHRFYYGVRIIPPISIFVRIGVRLLRRKLCLFDTGKMMWRDLIPRDEK